MPRKVRIDAPGALHRIVIRGIERKAIFKDDTDLEDFIERLSSLLQETITPCYAWALSSNHVHLLLRTGTQNLSVSGSEVACRFNVDRSAISRARKSVSRDPALPSSTKMIQRGLDLETSQH